MSQSFAKLSKRYQFPQAFFYWLKAGEDTARENKFHLAKQTDSQKFANCKRPLRQIVVSIDPHSVSAFLRSFFSRRRWKTGAGNARVHHKTVRTRWRRVHNKKGIYVWIFFFFLFECRPSRRGAADRVASKVPQMGDTWVWLGSLLHVYCKYVQYVCPGGLSAEKGGLSNVMKTTAAKNHLARAAPRCRPNGKWSTVWYAVWQSQQNISLNVAENSAAENWKLKTENSKRKTANEKLKTEKEKGAADLIFHGRVFAASVGGREKLGSRQMFTSKYATSSGKLESQFVPSFFLVEWEFMDFFAAAKPRNRGNNKLEFALIFSHF